jgi:hypothetical protein
VNYPIEGVWCERKRFVRKYNDQDFSKLHGLIEESIESFQEKNLNIKLWKRFWKAVEMYFENKAQK